jgi:hypothetical protein
MAPPRLWAGFCKVGSITSMMAIVTIAMPSLMDRFISNLRFLQVVIKPRRASEQTKLDLAQLDSSKDEPLP